MSTTKVYFRGNVLITIVLSYRPQVHLKYAH